MIDICRSNCSDRRSAEFEVDSGFYRDAWQEELAETHPVTRSPASLALCICSNSVSTCGGGQLPRGHDGHEDRDGQDSLWGPVPGRAPWNDPVAKSLPIMPMVEGKAGKHGAPATESQASSSGCATSSLTAGMLSNMGGTPDGRNASPVSGWGSASEAALAKVGRSLSLDDTLTSTTRATEDAHDSGWDVHPSHWHGRCGYVLRLRPDAPPGPWLCHHFSVDGAHIVQNGLAVEHANHCAGELRPIDGEADSFDALVEAPGRCMGLRKPDTVGYPVLLRCSRPPAGPVCRRDSCPYLAQNVICPYIARITEHAAVASAARSEVGSRPSEDRESSSAVAGLDPYENSRELPSSPGASRLQGELIEDS